MKCKKASRNFLLLTFPAFFAAVLLSCNVEPQAGGTVSPTINLKGLSSDVDEIVVTITGPGIDQQESFSSDTSKIVVPLPEADNVHFDVEGMKKSVGDGPIYSYREAQYADLVAGKSVVLDFLMTPYRTKILVPDNGYNRIVQIDDMNINEPEGWTYYYQSDGFNPYDVAIDNGERIWVSNGSQTFLSYFNDGISPDTTVNTLSDIWAFAIAYDNYGAYLYYFFSDLDQTIKIGRLRADATGIESDDSKVYNLTSEDDLIETTTFNKFGLDVDENGCLYFLADDELGQTLFKYDPERSEGNRVINTFNLPNLTYAEPANDILVKNDRVYISNAREYDEKPIIVFDTNLNLVGTYGSWASDSSQGRGKFYGPLRFLATTNPGIYLTDEDTSDSVNQIVSFENTDFDGWQTYAPESQEVDPFVLFYQGELLQ